METRAPAIGETAAPIASPYRVALPLVALTCALAPAYVVRWRVGFLPTTLLEAAVLVTLAAFGVESMRAGAARHLRWRSALAPPAVLLLAAAAAAVLAAPRWLPALGLYRAYFVEPALFALAAATVVRSPGAARLVLAGLGVGAATVALVNLALAADLLHRGAFNATWMPPVAVYTSQNAVSLYLDPLVAVAASMLVHGRGRLDRGAAALFLAVALPAEALGLSRGGWAALAAIALGLALTLRWSWLPLAAGALAALALAWSGTAAGLFNAVKGNTLAGRLEAWQAAMAMLRERPLFGSGLGGYPELIRPYWSHYDPLWALYPHNVVLNFWVETGLLGLAAFAWIVAAAVALAWRGWRRGAPGWRPIHLGVLLALVAVVVHGLVDVPYFKNDLSLEFWALLALLVAGTESAGEPATENEVSVDHPDHGDRSK